MLSFIGPESPDLTKQTSKISKLTKKQKNQIKEMKKFLQSNDEALAVSANQIGLDICVFVCKNSGEILTVINPEVIWTSTDDSDEIIQGERGLMEKDSVEFEKCMSFPGIKYLITRPTAIKVNYMTEKGVFKRVTLTGAWARLFLHEIDHLNGIRVIDRAEDSMPIEEDENE